MEIVYRICCGIDVHAKFLVACLIHDGKKERRRFSTMTDDLLELRDWLVQAGCRYVAIESTGVYWKPVFNVLESDLEVILVNPEHAKALRGRKTDRKDAEWLADLLQYGALSPSFIPPLEIRELRELTRYRESLIRERTAVSNRIQKVIESANIKLGQVASDVLGVSGRAMLRALAKGETDAGKLANLAQGKLKEKRGELVRALDGRLTPNQRFVLGELLDQIAQLEAAEDRLNREINRYLTDPQHPQLLPAWELLQSIPGVGPRVAEVIIAEIGVAMKETFPTDAHLASWVGLCPGQKETGGKRKSGKTRHGNTYLRSALVQAAWAVTKKKAQTYLKSQFYRLVRRLGRKKALVAVAHSLIVIVYHVLEREQSYTELGGDYFDRQQADRQRDYYLRRLAELGLKVTVEQAPAQELPAVA